MTGLKSLSVRHRQLVVNIANKLQDRNALATFVGGEAALNALPMGKFSFPDATMFAAVKTIATIDNKINNINLLPLLLYTMTSSDNTMRYNAFGLPNVRADTHAIVTPTMLQHIFRDRFKGVDDLAEVWHTVFAKERDRVLHSNCRGARLISLLSATTNGERISFLYADLNSLNKPAATTVPASRGLVRLPLFNMRS